MRNYRETPEFIEDQIEQTRRRFDRRVEELSAQVTPENIVQQAIGSRSGSAADTIDALIHTAKTSPVSAALAALGLAGMFFNRSSRPPAPPSDLPVATDPAQRTADHLRAMKGHAAHTADSIGEAAEETVRSAGDAARAAAAQGVDAAKSAFSDASSSVRDAAERTTSSAQQQARQTAQSISEKAQNIAEDAGEAAYRSGVGGYKIARNHAAHAAREAPAAGARLAGEATTWARENPVPVGLAALALGAAAASFISYRRESSIPDPARNFPVAPDPEPKMEPTPAAQEKPRKRAPANKTVAKTTPVKAASKAKSTSTATRKKKSPNVSAAMPASQSKIGSNITESTSVLGAPDAADGGKARS